MNNQIEVYILSGFLGSGKTTLLKNILRQEQELNRKIAVVMNELGKVSIDSDAVEEEVPLKELLNGCVCCTIQGQLENHLHSLIQENKLDAIYIETTGVAHPIEVLDACMSPLIADRLKMKGIITLVDAFRWKDRKNLSIQLQKLLQEQVMHADLVLLNKTDQLSESEQASLVLVIQNLNSTGKTILTSFADIDLKVIHSLTKRVQQKHEKIHVQEDLHLKTYLHKFTNPVDLEKFEDWLRNMPDTIYRIKGYLRFSHSSGTYLFQYSYGMPLYMKELMNHPMNLVFIGENLDHAKLKAELMQLETH